MSGGARGPVDPYRAHVEAPALWRAYLHAHFRDHYRVAAAFDVSEKCARNWWTGATGARHDKIIVAVGLHPDTAPAMLFRVA